MTQWLRGGEVPSRVAGERAHLARSARAAAGTGRRSRTSGRAEATGVPRRRVGRDRSRGAGRRRRARATPAGRRAGRAATTPSLHRLAAARGETLRLHRRTAAARAAGHDRACPRPAQRTGRSGSHRRRGASAARRELARWPPSPGGGSRREKVEPTPTVLRTSTDPPMASASSRTIARPSPVPTGRSEP